MGKPTVGTLKLADAQRWEHCYAALHSWGDSRQVPEHLLEAMRHLADARVVTYQIIDFHNGGSEVFLSQEDPGLRQYCAAFFALIHEARRSTALLRRVRELSGMLEAVEEGFISVDAALTVRQMTRRAHDILRRHFPDEPGRGLPKALAAWARHAVNATDLGASVMGHTTAAGVIKARLSRMRGATRGGCGDAGGRWLVTLEEQNQRKGPGILRRLALTTRESEVLWWIAQGKSNSEIAIIIDARVRTIEKHVEHILRKLDVETRGAAAARAHECF